MYSLKKEIIISNKAKITKVCIDDFVIKKGEKYATVMIDIDTYLILYMINSHDHDYISEWLGEFPNLKVISRDGSLTYKKAITTAHENAIQVMIVMFQTSV